MDSFAAGLIGGLACAALLAATWLPRMRALERQNRQLLDTVIELCQKLASRNPEEYRAWTAPPFVAETPPEPRLYDETGLLSAPLEDRLED